MSKLLTALRLPVLAALLTLSLTSCFDRQKRDDPKPRSCSGKPTTAAPGSNP